MQEIAPDSNDSRSARHMRGDDDILAEVMMTEGSRNDPETPAKSDPVVEHFVELRKYIEHSHEGLSKTLGKVEGGLQRLDGRQDKVEGRLERLERKVDAGFDRTGRKIDALAAVRRAAPRRRKP